MGSIYNPKEQETSIDTKIAIALERISEAYKVMLWEDAKKNNLSPLQVQILLFTANHKEVYNKPAYLAKEFNITKATISDAVATLVQKGLLTKVQDKIDKRSVQLKLTTKGKKLSQLLGISNKRILESTDNTPVNEKEILLNSLFSIILDLQKAGIVSIQRMCFTCNNYSQKGEQHFCSLLNKELLKNELRIDCEEHQNLKV